jgi:hypothetical protein
MADDCAKYQAVFERRIVPVHGAELTDAVRTDTVLATRRMVTMEAVRRGVQQTYRATAAVGPIFLWLAWLTVPLISSLVVTPSGWSLFGLIVSAVVAALADQLINHWTRPTSSAVVLLLFCVAGYWLFRYRETDLAVWWQSGLLLGLLAGLTIAILLAALQFGLATFASLRKLGNFRVDPEGEFTQTALLTITMIEGGDSRAYVVFEVEYLALVLERGVVGVLSWEDAVSADSIRAELGTRAARLRALKRQLLFGRQGAKDELLTWLDDAVVAAARRDWLALPVAEAGDATTPPGRRTRVSRTLTRIFVFLLPVILGGIAWWSGIPLDTILPAALPFVVIWMGVQLAEMATPGGGEELSRSASAASGTSSVLAQILHIPSGR